MDLEVTLYLGSMPLGIYKLSVDSRLTIYKEAIFSFPNKGYYSSQASLITAIGYMRFAL